MATTPKQNNVIHTTKKKETKSQPHASHAQPCQPSSFLHDEQQEAAPAAASSARKPTFQPLLIM
jgi:hypothetical protein